MIDQAMTFLDWFGVVVFATTGSLAAARKRMDLYGFILLGTATGIGGGTIRDAVLGATPVFWITSPEYLLACVAVSSAVFFLAHIRNHGRPSCCDSMQLDWRSSRSLEPTGPWPWPVGLWPRWRWDGFRRVQASLAGGEPRLSQAFSGAALRRSMSALRNATTADV